MKKQVLGICCICAMAWSAAALTERADELMRRDREVRDNIKAAKAHDSALAVVEQFQKSIIDSNYSKATEFLDPESMKNFKRDYLQKMKKWKKSELSAFLSTSGLVSIPDLQRSAPSTFMVAFLKSDEGQKRVGQFLRQVRITSVNLKESLSDVQGIFEIAYEWKPASSENASVKSATSDQTFYVTDFEWKWVFDLSTFPEIQ